MRLWYLDLQERKPVLVDTAVIWEISQYTWSPDSMWIAFAKRTDNGMAALFLYSLDSRAVTQVTEDVAHSGSPVFDPDGSWLYFLSDRDVSPVLGHLELSFTVNRMTRPYALCLRSDVPSPFAPRSDEAKLEGDDKAPEKPAAAGEAKKTPFRIDLQGIRERLVSFPVTSGEYGGLRAVKGRILYIASPPQDGSGARSALRLFDLEKRKEADVLAAVDDFDLSPDGSRLIYKSGGTYGIIEVKEGAKAGDGRLDLLGLRMEIDPASEWAQVFDDVWRITRDFFYLPDMGGVDWPAMKQRYRALLPYVSHRFDLTYILGEMVSELGSGHSYVGGGDQPQPERLAVGVLGADLELDRESSLWRITRILEGQNWIEARRSPLTEPGVGVAAGDFLLAIDGKDLSGAEEPWRLLVQKAGRPVTLLVSPRPTREGAREVVVRTVASEADLRYHDWVSANRRKVDQATGGRVGYVHIPDMGIRGLQEFIRQYYPQIRKEGLIVDVRFNGGGFVSQIILERLRRILVGMDAPRNARPDTIPQAVLNGPMVALLNQYSASDGDLFPHYFRRYGLGPLIGKRSWGGVVGIRGIPGGLVDGGYLNVPEFAHYGMQSDWHIENRGVEPDIEVDNLPQDEMEGKDAQLERGIQEILRLVAERKPSFPPRPPSRDLRPPAPRKEGKDL